MMNIYKTIAGLLYQANTVGLLAERDIIYARNRLMARLHVDSLPEEADYITEESIPDLLEALTAYAVEKELIEDTFDAKEIFQANTINDFMPLPSTVQEHFWKKYEQKPEVATDYFYQLSQHSNYIQMNRIRKNVHFKTVTDYGNIDITINLSKPEKDPEQIRREKEMKRDLDYPPCVLCVENEGYDGRIGYPARANHRIVDVPLGEENWYLQYSPYVYYNEHSIVLSETHELMSIDKKTFDQLLSFVEMFPHYFIGSNADLPIVGGSILSHNHYQAGRYEFAIEWAEPAFLFALPQFPTVAASVLHWPMTVIRLKAADKTELVNAAEHIFKTWQTYEDRDADIIPFTGDTAHQTVTPIVRYRDNQFEFDIVLRNNRTTEAYPQGIFHPHEDVHHIKKENIGLIEVMGLAVLPARLIEELEEIQAALLDHQISAPAIHAQWVEELRAAYGKPDSSATAKTILQKELGNKFIKVLSDASVYKQTSEGKAALQRFIERLNREAEQ